MKRIYFALIAALFAFTSCEEWDQVFTLDYGKADVYEPVTMTPNTTIAELKALYKSGPVKIDKDIVIGGTGCLRGQERQHLQEPLHSGRDEWNRA